MCYFIFHFVWMELHNHNAVISNMYNCTCIWDWFIWLQLPNPFLLNHHTQHQLSIAAEFSDRDYEKIDFILCCDLNFRCDFFPYFRIYFHINCDTRQSAKYLEIRPNIAIYLFEKGEWIMSSHLMLDLWVWANILRR